MLLAIAALVLASHVKAGEELAILPWLRNLSSALFEPAHLNRTLFASHLQKVLFGMDILGG
jgi:hypothetical protein